MLRTGQLPQGDKIQNGKKSGIPEKVPEKVPEKYRRNTERPHRVLISL